MPTNWVDLRGGGARRPARRADRSKWRIVTFAHVARDAREGARPTWRTASPTSPVLHRRRHLPDHAARHQPIRPSILTSSGLACIGTPDDCIRHFERLWQGSNGGFGAVLLLAHNWADWEATKRSYELMARYVHPHFQRQSNTLRVASYDNATAKHETAGAEFAEGRGDRDRALRRGQGQGGRRQGAVGGADPPRLFAFANNDGRRILPAKRQGGTPCNSATSR